MKIKSLLTAAILLSVSYITPIYAQSAPNAENGAFVAVESNIDPMDSVEVSLLTCSPHEEIYSLYGHAAIRWHQGDTDLVFNWGMFSFSKPYFALRFVFGLTDYELAAYPFERFWPYYQQWGSSITEQVLNLTNDEKRTLQRLLGENLQEENRVYRYNFFYNNCSTKPRDVIEKSIEGQVVYEERSDYQPTFREMVRECNRNHLWSKFGNDMLLGVKADLATTREEQEFLPMNLMTDFAHAQIYKDGEYRPLVKEQRLLVPPGVQVIEPDFGLCDDNSAVAKHLVGERDGIEANLVLAVGRNGRVHIGIERMAAHASCHSQRRDRGGKIRCLHRCSFRVGYYSKKRRGLAQKIHATSSGPAQTRPAPAAVPTSCSCRSPCARSRGRRSA